MPKVFIIGAGISGLSAGIYAQKSGFETTIFEKHTIPGGNNTAWKRNGYHFEGGMHWLNGSKDGKSLNRLWRETGAINSDTKIRIVDPFMVCDCGKQEISLFRDLNKFEKHLLDFAPEDKREIKKLVRNIRRFTKINIPVVDILGVKVTKRASFIRDIFKMLPALLQFPKLNKILAADYAMRFKNPALRLMLTNVVGPGYDAKSLFFMLGALMSNDGGYLENGSLQMSQNMADYYTKLGGKILYRQNVKKVIEYDEKTGKTGLIVNDERLFCDAVVVSCDTLTADKFFYKKLPWVEKMREKSKLTISTLFSYGFKTKLDELPETGFFLLDEPLEFCGQTVNQLGFHNYSQYSGYAPDGCSAVTVYISADTYDYWKKQKENGTYKQKKQEYCNIILKILEEKYPVLKNKAEVFDIATPLTYERYVGTFHGSWMTKTSPGQRRKAYPCKRKELKNIYFAGQRLLPPGGMPPAVITGRRATQYLCRDFGKTFRPNLQEKHKFKQKRNIISEVFDYLGTYFESWKFYFWDK